MAAFANAGKEYMHTGRSGHKRRLRAIETHTLDPVWAIWRSPRRHASKKFGPWDPRGVFVGWGVYESPQVFGRMISH